MYIWYINDVLSDDIKKKFMLPLTIELQDHKEKCFITPQSPLLLAVQPVEVVFNWAKFSKPDDNFLCLLTPIFAYCPSSKGKFRLSW